jgi:hypothetical protein
VIAGYAVGILVVLVLFGWLTFWVTHRRSGVAAAAAIRNR